MTNHQSRITEYLRKAGFGIVAMGALMAAQAPAQAGNAGIRDAEIERILRKYTDPIFKAGNLDPKAVHVYLINDPSINAFVAGGQNVFLHTGLIMTLDTPNELKGVIAHETGHITGGHLARGPEAAGKAEVPMLIGMLAGVAAIAAGVPDLGMALLMGSQSVAQRELLAYSRTQESSADQAGAKFMTMTGQSPRGMLKVFDRLANDEAMSGYHLDKFATNHPLSRERISDLESLVDQSPTKDKVDSDADLAEYALMRAKLRGFIETPEVVLRRYPYSDHSQPARYARAAAYFRASQLDRAIPEIDSLIAERPNYAYFWELKGQILMESSRAAEAVAPYRKAVDLAPNEPLIRASLGAAMLESEDKTLVKDAEKQLKTALKDEPDNAMAWYYLANAYGDAGNEGLAALATAERYYQLDAFGQAASFARRASAHLKEGTNDWQRANDIMAVAQVKAADARGRDDN